MDSITSHRTLLESENTMHRKAGAFVRTHKLWLTIVVLPTLIAAAYYFLIAANQYESEAHIIVRAVSPSSSIPSGLGQILNLGNSGGEQAQALSVGDYLMSHDAVAALQPASLTETFRRPEADMLSRLRQHPTPETLLKYYRDHVQAKLDSDTGLIVVKVRTFRPTDSYDLVKQLLVLGERRVNSLNRRSYDDSLRMARQQLAAAETELTAMQRRMSTFRRTSADIDPKGTGEAQIALATQLRQQLALAKSQLSVMGATISSTSPQYAAMAARVSGLQAQVNAADGRLTQGDRSISSNLGTYEELRLRQEFAGKRYEAAAAGLEKARDQALRQQFFVVRVVEPNMPVKSLYPHRFTTVLTVFLGLFLAYAIGWLIAAGMREHAA